MSFLKNDWKKVLDFFFSNNCDIWLKVNVRFRTAPALPPQTLKTFLFYKSYLLTSGKTSFEIVVRNLMLKNSRLKLKELGYALHIFKRLAAIFQFVVCNPY